LWVFCFQKYRKFIFVNNWKQKTKHTKCIWVSMLARYFLLGCTKWIHLSLQTSANLKIKTTKFTWVVFLLFKIIAFAKCKKRDIGTKSIFLINNPCKSMICSFLVSLPNYKSY
jgi:hypothetical protein